MYQWPLDGSYDPFQLWARDIFSLPVYCCTVQSTWLGSSLVVTASKPRHLSLSGSLEVWHLRIWAMLRITLNTWCYQMWLAIIGDRDYWSYPSGRSVRLYTNGCVVDSGTGLMGPCSPPFAVWNFDTCIEVQLSTIAGEYTLSSNLA